VEIEEKLNQILMAVESNEIIHPSKPGKFSEEIKDTGEKAFQRAILDSKSTKLEPDIKVDWFDLELPVILNQNSRRQCIDLIGHDSNRFVLCELKFNNKKDSPNAATRELLEYYRLILKNAAYLDSYSIHHTNNVCNRNWQWVSIKKDNPILVVAANEKYWNYWGKTKKVDFYEQLKQIKAWSEELKVDIFLYKTQDVDFKKQKVDDQPYRPFLCENSPWERIKN
jgi:hypothetical protein